MDHETTDATTTSDEASLVTVLICVHNAGEHLRPCVESIVAQTYRNLEILVVDDGSDDGCIDTIRDLRDHRIRILTQENLGKSTALNRAIRESRGEFLAIQDADDLSRPTRIERQVHSLHKNPDVAAVFCGHDLILNGRHLAPRTRSHDREGCHRTIARMALPAMDPTAVYRRSLVQDFAYEPYLEVAQGLDYILRVGEQHAMLVLGECLYSYRVSPTSVTRRNADRKLGFVHTVCERACRRRGLPVSRAADFFQDAHTLGRNRVLDNNLPAHFMESSLDLRYAGHRFKAVANAAVCTMLRPFDRHYYKALLYSLLPSWLVRRMRRTLNHERVAPIPPVLRQAEASGGVSTGNARRLRTARPMRICMFGAAGDTGNLGVSALLYSALGGIAAGSPESQVTVFDNGWGMRSVDARLNGGTFAYRLCGARLSRRYHRPESFLNMRVASWFGGVGNPGVRAILEADAIWDVSGGDSFCDLYGARHLRAMVEPKRIALAHGIPLVLLPQTYGPFSSRESRQEAAQILARATLAWARDEESYAALLDLVGEDFDPQRHRSGVDMAFALEPRAPAREALGPVAEWLDSRSDGPMVGLNVSGLIYNDPDAVQKYGLRADYRRVTLGILRELLTRTDARVILVPHVVVRSQFLEADQRAGI